jgi:hypothetical protein
MQPGLLISLPEPPSGWTMRIARTLASVGVCMLVIAGCEGGNSPVGPTPEHEIIGSFPVTLPTAGDGVTTAEEFQVCKYGSSGDFSYSVKSNSTGAVVNHTITVANGGCQVLAIAGSTGSTVTITETGSPAGFVFDHADVTNSTGINPTTSTTTTTTNATVSGVIGGGVIGFPGVTVKYYNRPLAQGEIGDFVWDDVNANGVQDAGEPGIPGQVVVLTGPVTATTSTDANGKYLFSGLAAGTYTVSVGTPTGFAPTAANQGGDPLKDSNVMPATVTLPAFNSTDYSVDFGFVHLGAGTIGDFVWHDANGNGIQDTGEPGIAGVTVTLGGAGSATTTTDATGFYAFTGLNAGTYTVTVGTPAGYTPSPTGQGTTSTDNNGSPATVTLTSYNSSDLTIDFGFKPDDAGQIGDFVWNDINGDGIQDAGETGISGITVTLSGPVNTSVVTDGSGAYLFTGLPVGAYTVTVTCPAGYAQSPSGRGGDANKDSNGSPASVGLAAYNSTDYSIDFGCVAIPAGQIGDFVWNDLNGNGVQDAGEPGLAGVTVTLGGAASATTTTSASGAYLFSGLSAGTYTVTVGTPSGFAATGSNLGGNPNKDSNGSPASVTLASFNSVDLSVDFGFIENKAGEIGDFVWNDANSNGVQDAGETGLGGVTVTLTGTQGGSTVTSGTGAYLFTGLPAGTYSVTVTCPAGYSPSAAGQGGDPLKDSNSSPSSVTLASNTSTDLSIDFGCKPNPAGQIGDFVWKDINGNGVQDAGEPGIGGLTVTLTGPVVASTVTNGFGAYLFSDLPAGSYTVTVATPASYTASPSNQGGDPAKDSNGSPASVTLAAFNTVNLTIDFGFVPVAAPTGQIGDYVWEDEDGDGVQDATETGMSGLTVTLSGPVNATTTTDANGAYLFTGLPAGTYTVTVATPAGFTASPSNQGSPISDSNGSPATVTLATSSSTDLTIDFGFVPPQGVGRMTGGGAQITAGNVRVSRGFTLHCDIILANNLEINWPGTGNGASSENNFHITRPLTSAQCILDPKYKQPPPAAPFNTFIGVAAGTLNGVAGARAEFTFIDAGEPGRNDKAQIKVYAPNGQLVLNVPLSYLDHGNIQAHYDQPHGSKAPR